MTYIGDDAFYLYEQLQQLKISVDDSKLEIIGQFAFSPELRELNKHWCFHTDRLFKINVRYLNIHFFYHTTTIK